MFPHFLSEYGSTSFTSDISDLGELEESFPTEPQGNNEILTISMHFSLNTLSISPFSKSLSILTYIWVNQIYFLDINECETEGACGTGGTCSNTPDLSYTCECETGYVGGGEASPCSGKFIFLISFLNEK